VFLRHHELLLDYSFFVHLLWLRKVGSACALCFLSSVEIHKVLKVMGGWALQLEQFMHLRNEQDEQWLTRVSQSNKVVATTQYKMLARQRNKLGCNALQLDVAFKQMQVDVVS